MLLLRCIASSVTAGTLLAANSTPPDDVELPAAEARAAAAAAAELPAVSIANCSCSAA